MKSHIAEAIAVLAELPEDRQAMIAHAILDYAVEEMNAYRLQDEERSEILTALAEVEQGDLASEAHIAQTYRRIGI